MLLARYLRIEAFRSDEQATNTFARSRRADFRARACRRKRKLPLPGVSPFRAPLRRYRSVDRGEARGNYEIRKSAIIFLQSRQARSRARRCPVRNGRILFNNRTR